MSLKEIAKKVGVSVSTASRVINSNNKKAASDELKKNYLMPQEKLDTRQTEQHKL